MMILGEIMIQEKKRIDYIDVLKGFAILTVVFLHVHSGYDVDGTVSGYAIRYFRSFQMSIFFAMSGILFNPVIKDYREKIIGKIKTLFLPSVLWGGVIGVAVNFVRMYLGSEGIDNFNIKKEITYLLLGRSSYFGSWFVFSLFGVYLLEYFISYICKKININYFSVYVVVLHVAFAVGGLFIGRYTVGTYYNIRYILVASLLFYIGYVYQQSKKHHIVYIDIAAIIIGFVLSMVNSDIVVFSDFNFANPLVSLLASISTIYGLIGVTQVLSKKINFPFLKLMGRNSIIVLYTHFLLILSVIRILEKLLHLPIHTFPAILSFLIIVVIEFVLAKFMPKSLKKLFGIYK